MNEPIAPPPGPMPFRFLIDEAMRYVRRHWREAFLPVALPVALLAGVSGVLSLAKLERFYDAMATGEPPSPFAMWSPSMVAITLVDRFFVLAAFTAMAFAVTDAVSGRRFAVREAWSAALKPRAFGTAVLTALLTFAALVCCCVPILFVGPLLSLTVIAMRAEGVHGFAALSRSAELALYNPSRRFFDLVLVKLLGVGVIGFALYSLLSFIVSLPFSAPLWVEMFRQMSAGEPPILDPQGPWMWLQVPVGMVVSMALTGLFLYLFFCTALLFFDTRNRKEGRDLQQAMDTVFAP